MSIGFGTILVCTLEYKRWGFYLRRTKAVCLQTLKCDRVGLKEGRLRGEVRRSEEKLFSLIFPFRMGPTVLSTPDRAANGEKIEAVRHPKGK